jgi:hypothetical protein
MNGIQAGFCPTSGRPKIKVPRLRAVMHFGVQARVSFDMLRMVSEVEP